MAPDPDRVRANLARVQEQITAACARSHRDPGDVRLVAVTKTVDVEVIRTLASLGVTDIGENRAGDGVEKAQALADLDLRWHFIGHLQRNKAAKVVSAFRIVHSVESAKLVDVLQHQAEKLDIRLGVLLEVNISGEGSKYGLSTAEVSEIATQVAAKHHLSLQGLMTMAPYTEDAEETRPVFRGLREVRERLQEETGLALPELSMGMSNDFEVAVEEGATLVRIGSALFV